MSDVGSNYRDRTLEKEEEERANLGDSPPTFILYCSYILSTLKRSHIHHIV